MSLSTSEIISFLRGQYGFTAKTLAAICGCLPSVIGCLQRGDTVSLAAKQHVAAALKGSAGTFSTATPPGLFAVHRQLFEQVCSGNFEAFSQLVFTYRWAKKITQRELAEAASCGVAEIVKIEKGQHAGQHIKGHVTEAMCRLVEAGIRRLAADEGLLFETNGVDFGATVRAFRKLLNLRPQRFGACVGCSYLVIAKIEGGKHPRQHRLGEVSMDVCRRVLKVLERDPVDVHEHPVAGRGVRGTDPARSRYARPSAFMG